MSTGTGWNCRAVKHFEATNRKLPVNLTIEDAFNAARVGSFLDGIRIGADLINNRYEKATEIAASAVDDIKIHWISTGLSINLIINTLFIFIRLCCCWRRTGGTCFNRTKVVNKLIAYYLISLAIYIIEICFWTNGKMIRGVASLVMDSPDNSRIFIGLCMAAIFMLFVFFLGGETGDSSSSSQSCSN